VAELLSSHHLDCGLVVLDGDQVAADEFQILEVLIHSEPREQTYLAVGSGTITDIVRFASFLTRNPFISLPTAPSVDGYTSSGAALAIGRTKRTLRAHPPVAIFADLDTLAAAPGPMIAAGFGDLLGKFTSLADWRLGHLIWGERFSDSITQRARKALDDGLAHADQIASASVPGIRCLMEALVESGLCIADFGSSEPASGSEHHLSHYWEMKLLRENRPALLHGAKVGVASILVSGIYQMLRSLTRDQVATRLSAAKRPDRETIIQCICDGYGMSADMIIADHSAFLDRYIDEFDGLSRRIVDHWTDIQEIAATVPPPQELADRLRLLDGPVTPPNLGITEQDASLAFTYAHYLRNRFTVLKLGYLLGIVGVNDCRGTQESRPRGVLSGRN
jgi:glycerol-1-phosphate dehydrogenase [NAD(P)+]